MLNIVWKGSIITLKNCKHSLMNIHFTASVYILFDNPLYISLESLLNLLIQSYTHCTLRILEPNLTFTLMYSQTTQDIKNLSEIYRYIWWSHVRGNHAKFQRFWSTELKKGHQLSISALQ